MLCSFPRPRAAACPRTSVTSVLAVRHSTTVSPASGTRISAIDTTARAMAAQSRRSQARSKTSCCSRMPARPAAMKSGRCQMVHTKAAVSSGTTTSTQPVTNRRARGLSSVTRGSGGCPGRRERSTGPTLANRSGTPARSDRM